MSEFAFVIGETPLSEWYLAWLVPLIYLAIISFCKQFSKKHSPNGSGFGFRWLVVWHNFSLSFVSAVLLGEMVLELARMFGEGGFWSVFCDRDGRWTGGHMYFCLYINYLLKYVELGDTFLLALRGKPTPFLHVYHHAATLVLCLTQLRGQTSLQWLVVTINLFVHVAMYAYYALQTLGYNVWWKRYITVLQIAQFVVVVAVCGAGFLITPMTAVGMLPMENRCHGDVASQTFGMAILVSYLFLFIQFYDRTYSPTHKKLS